MSYIFNRTNLAIIIVIVLIFALSINEIAKLTGKAHQANKAFYQEWLNKQNTTFTSQEDCQKKSGTICEYRTCDYIPTGMTIDEVCGEDFSKGWKPTSVVIPPLLQNVEIIRLTIETQSSIGSLEILPRVETISYQSTRLNNVNDAPTTKTLEINDITRLINKIILFDLISTPTPVINPESEDTLYSIYIASKESIPSAGTALADNEIREQSLRCQRSSCSRDYLDIVQSIIRLWDSPIIERH